MPPQRKPNSESSQPKLPECGARLVADDAGLLQSQLSLALIVLPRPSLVGPEKETALWRREHPRARSPVASQGYCRSLRVQQFFLPGGSPVAIPTHMLLQEQPVDLVATFEPESPNGLSPAGEPFGPKIKGPRLRLEARARCRAALVGSPQ